MTRIDGKIYRLLAVGIAMAAISGLDSGWAADPDPTAIAAEVDRHLDRWAADSEAPLPLVDDFTFLRRVYFDVTGRPPSPEGVRQFVGDSTPDKRARIVDRLLADKDYGDNWAHYWRDVILYRRSENRALLVSGAVTDYLTREFNQNHGWDKIARSFVTAEGDVQKAGETAVIMAQSGRPEETVAELARIFLGIQIQCAQCHDHPFDRWQREEFHELAAFFPRVSIRPIRAEQPRGFEVVGSDFVPKRRKNNNRYLGLAEHSMPDLEDPSARGQLMTPKFFLTGQELGPGTHDQARRQALADWMTSPENEWFSKAMVNRLWSELVGRGFYEPVDDLGPDRECVAPDALDCLASAFVASGYDVKFLFRCITRTKAYQRFSRSRVDTEPPDFSSAYPRRLRSDELLQALRSALDMPAGPIPPSVRRQLPRRPRDPSQLFALVFGFDPSEPRGEVSGSVPQSLLLMNSKLLAQLIGSKRPGGLRQLLWRYPDDQALIGELYLRTVSRLPQTDEIRLALQHVRSIPNRAEAYEDLLWALVNSAEFIHRI